MPAAERLAFDSTRGKLERRPIGAEARRGRKNKTAWERRTPLARNTAPQARMAGRVAGPGPGTGKPTAITMTGHVAGPGSGRCGDGVRCRGSWRAGAGPPGRAGNGGPGARWGDGGRDSPLLHMADSQTGIARFGYGNSWVFGNEFPYSR